jgi:pimeloyl-ACP methyl ester carboxylesterase
MTVTQERIRTCDGITLASDCYRHASGAPVVLLLHGGGQNRHAWATTARRLYAHGYTVVAYDTRGHGDSDWDPMGHYDVERLASDLIAVRGHVDTDRPPAVVGASLAGSRSSLRTCSRRPTYGQLSYWSTSPRGWNFTGPVASCHSWPRTPTGSARSMTRPT